MMEVTPNGKFKAACLSPCGSVQPCGSKEKPSTSLKERLRRTRRSFNAPSSVAKRLCVDDDEEVSKDSQEKSDKSSLIPSFVDANSNIAEATLSERDAEGGNSKCLTLKREKLRQEVRDKTETLRRLKMVKTYRSKNNLAQLQILIDKWRSCAQAALYELQSDVPVDGQKAELSDLIDRFGLDDRILHFDRAMEDFTL